MNSETAFPVLLLAGSDPDRRELMKVYDPGRNLPSKALLPMAGKRVLDWQLEAMAGSKYIGQIYLIGLSQKEFPSAFDLSFIPFKPNSSILEKIQFGAGVIKQDHPAIEHIIVFSGDAPGMSTSSIDLFFGSFRQNQDADLLIGVVPEDVTLDFFPDHKRVIGKFKEISVYPGEIYVFRRKIIPLIEDEIRQLTIQRRQFDRQKDTSKLIPVLRYLAKKTQLWPLIIKYSLGKLSITELESILSRVYRIKMKAIIVPDPGFGMDLDLPEDFEKLTNYIKLTKMPAS